MTTVQTFELGPLLSTIIMEFWSSAVQDILKDVYLISRISVR